MSDEGDTPDQAPQASARSFTETEAIQAHREGIVSRPRRVVLRHDDTGSYQILMGHRLIQGFCQEFEEITGYAIGTNLQQQVRIHIEPIGRRQHAHYPDREPIEEDSPVRITRHDEDSSLFSMAHPGSPTVTMTWQDEAREHINEQMTRMRQVLNLLDGM